MALNAMKLPIAADGGGVYRVYLQQFSTTGGSKGGNNPQNVTFIAPIKAKKFKYYLEATDYSDGNTFYVYLLSRNASGGIEATQVLAIYTNGGNSYNGEVDVNGEYVGLRYNPSFSNYDMGGYEDTSYFEVSA